MKHSLIPLLKFHPEQACPHTEKGGYWEAKWDEGSGEQAQTLPIKGQQKKQQHSFHYSLPSFSRPDWRTRNEKFIVYDWKIYRLRTIGCGYQTAGGRRWTLMPSTHFTLWPDAGKEWGLLLDFSPLFSPRPKRPYLAICGTSCTEATVYMITEWVSLGGQHTNFYA